MDELYVLARRVLLDALDALAAHRDATILVGAQAIYLHTGEGALEIAPFTTDADFALDPWVLTETPPLEAALGAAGFHLSTVGIWKTMHKDERERDVAVSVDLLVPSSVSAGRGRRAASLQGHAGDAARKVAGMEGALVDVCELSIASLEPDADARVIVAKVAGPGALLVSKVFKIHERRDTGRAKDKDALDVFRLLQAIETTELLTRLERMLLDTRSRQATEQAMRAFEELFGTRGSEGTRMAARAAVPVLDEDEVRLSCESLAQDLLVAWRTVLARNSV